MTRRAPSQDLDKTLAKARQAHRAGEHSTAFRLYQTYLKDHPKDPHAWGNVGVLLRAAKMHDLAAKAQRRAYDLLPDHSVILHNYANILFDTGDYDASVDIRHMSMAALPDDPEQPTLLGRALRACGRAEEAERVINEGLKRFPEYAELRLQLALCQLARGEFKEGFRNYSARWETGELARPDLPLTRWQGEPVAGKTVLVMPEQGFGDTVFAARFLPRLQQAGARVLLYCKTPLTRLLSNLEGVSALAHNDLSKAEVDLWASLLDLPGLIGNASVPPPARLDLPDDALTRADKIIEPHAGAFRVAVVWSGSTGYKGNHKRSFSHRRFLSLTDSPEVQLFSLYKGPLLQRMIDDGSGLFLIDAAGNDRDFADSAALISRMHLVITMDSAIAHIAGSMGVEVWNLLDYDPYWLYGHQGETTPWYPSMRLIRQPGPGDWDAVFDRVRADLADRTRAWKNRSRKP
jgi:tetratricopeptide (TPR) repeat protein